ncbi:Chloride intracellular channel exc-4 [Caligus rogercresseyi]|uniref:Chloride intracellular channel exc-4 n=1 Tax=Caligus rogercresseyi TaxID=217165 RepID=A0A7T8HFT2_CALRO|nr:Chloride intracellular channel exc-4 [Caligus rogercresseyi]
MPRLQHLRVAGKFFLNYEIPLEYSSLWKYLGEMYGLDAFVQSCPADQDIIHNYKNQQLPCNMTSNQKRVMKNSKSLPTHYPYLMELSSNKMEFT